MLDAKEAEAVSAIARALDGLEPGARARVMLYMRGRFDAMDVSTLASQVSAAQGQDDGTKGKAANKIIDIQQLKKEKAPKSDVEMAALVAYYLMEQAPAEERKDVIGTADLDKYFKQAHYPIPSRLGNTLNNTKNAGYLDLVSHGRYRLNAVGYNLAAHNLPGGNEAAVRPRRRTSSRRKGKGPARASGTRTPSRTPRST